MGSVTPHAPVLFILSAFSRHDEALDWARARGEAEFGPVALASERFAFQETDYYQPSMGPDLKKTFWAFERLIDPSELVEIKLRTNAWEAAYAQQAAEQQAQAELRPLNLDPGYLTLAKLVLASTKDHAHRVYLNRGIYGEVTLHYHDGRWQQRPWTFPDYRREDYAQFFALCRQFLKAQRR
jgi:hypothetical protein